MVYRYKKHYSREEASALLPQVRQWLTRLVELRANLQKYDQQLASLRQSGDDLGGKLINSGIRIMAEIKDVLLEFHRREIQLKDLDRGLIDFPAILSGKEVF